MTDATEEAARKLFAGSCDFVWGATSAESLPPEKLDEVAFVGRSNAGKSSLVNALTGRKSLARVSQTPGATRQINFFHLADRLALLDQTAVSYGLVLTKADELKASERAGALEKAGAEAARHTAALAEIQLTS